LVEDLGEDTVALLATRHGAALAGAPDRDQDHLAEGLDLPDRDLTQAATAHAREADEAVDRASSGHPGHGQYRGDADLLKALAIRGRFGRQRRNLGDVDRATGDAHPLEAPREVVLYDRADPAHRDLARVQLGDRDPIRVAVERLHHARAIELEALA